MQSVRAWLGVWMGLWNRALLALPCLSFCKTQIIGWEISIRAKEFFILSSKASHFFDGTTVQLVNLIFSTGQTRQRILATFKARQFIQHAVKPLQTAEKSKQTAASCSRRITKFQNWEGRCCFWTASTAITVTTAATATTASTDTTAATVSRQQPDRAAPNFKQSWQVSK